MSNAHLWVSAFRGIVGEAHIIQDPERLKEYAVDGLAPKAVVSPGSREEIAELLVCANTEKLAVVPRGNGTKMAAGGIPGRLDVVLSMLRIDRIVEHDIPNLSLSVEAGITLADVQKKLVGTGKGSFLPLDPPYTERATVGGVIATNSSGPRRYLYNSARDLLLGVKAVLPTGEIVAFGGKTVKNVSGYDMTKLMIGSWGTLGVITEITTKLLPLPEASATLLASFAELAKAGSFSRKVLHSVLLPSAMELMDERAAGQFGEKTKYLVAFSLEGVEEAVERQAGEIGEMAKKEGAAQTKVLRGEEERAFWIRVRDFALVSAASVVLKSSFVISRQTEILGNYETWAQAAGVDCAFVGHAGNGIIRSYMPDCGAAKTAPAVELIEKFTAEAAKHGGNLVVEAAPREIKEELNVWGWPRSDEVVMRRLKEKMDPNGVLNPGRFVGGI
ncbi:MAG: FAD-binding oxidoreductase [Proteobacteria bacterium]|nr:FAD-binding oxidoreductase [Pseudomonadota bacterium]